MSGLVWSGVKWRVRRKARRGERRDEGRREGSGGNWSEREDGKVDWNGVKWN